jgi:hypothetical protein
MIGHVKRHINQEKYLKMKLSERRTVGISLFQIFNEKNSKLFPYVFCFEFIYFLLILH